MKRMLATLFVLATVGCSHAPVVSNPDEKPTSSWTGHVDPLRELLKGKTKAVVVFVHGVGDHCPGFALDAKTGWLKQTSWSTLGLVPVSDAPALYTDVYDSEFIPNHPNDSASKMTFGIREFWYAPEGGDRIPLTAIEITWSQLTQWIKTNQLGYDLTEAVDPPNNATDGCPYKNGATYKKPLSREALNRLIKEETLDRDLADAVLYAGAYGRVMRRGMADTLCRALQGTKNSDSGGLCVWPKVPDEDQRSKTAYFFVTHSLGSRLIYDTLLALNGKDVLPNADTFSTDEMHAASDYAGYLMATTSAFYMMANQLPMLGLAYEDGTHTSENGGIGYDEIRSSSPLLKTVPAVPLTPNTASATVSPASLNANANIAPVAFGRHRRDAAQKLKMPVDSLKIVAFSDSNDLLSWGIPKWYQQKADADDPGVDFTNVYVTNSTHWFGVLEEPSAAHSNYLTSEDVWRVIHCGADQGHARSCK
jgi:hypothetical protein